MTQYSTKSGINMLVITNARGKIIMAYSGAIARTKWNELLNTVSLN